MDCGRLNGVFTALVTPFREDRSIDDDALRRLVDRQLQAGVTGIVACGTTGEAAALTPAEHQHVVAIIVHEVDGRAHVMAGAGTNNTRLAIELSNRCEDAGADSLLHVAPYYIKPTQEGLIRHFEAILTATKSPLVLYNVPGRTAVTIQPATALALAQHPRVIGIKQAVADLEQLSQLLDDRPDSLSVLSGEDSLTLAMIAMGADGVVSVVGNQQPAALVQLVEAALAGRRQAAIGLQRRLGPLMAANFIESNPIPVKFALFKMGLIQNILREPMTALAQKYEPAVMAAMQTAETAAKLEQQPLAMT